jgi:ATP/maltotriose-dependent transcriptional regulator MalT
MLITKLHIPASGTNLVHRPKLFEILNEGLQRKLILISAPAGFGKTTLLSDWIEQSKIPTAWISLDKRDNDPAEFMDYIIAGIRNIKSDFGESSQKLLNAPVKPNSESITGLLINDAIQIEEDFILVLDDFHQINSKEIFEIVVYLLEHIPAHMHLVISTRSDPPLQIARLRSQNQLSEIRLSDLSFSVNDISIFFNKKLKLGLSIDDIYSLELKTEGWIAGLQLAALSLRGRKDVTEFITAFAGDNRFIMDYLIEEVLNAQSDLIKDFLLRTSLLEQISGPLCDTVLNIKGSQSIIEYLDNNNMFIVPLDNERNCYRYHHLFADLLKQRLHIEMKGSIDELHNRACLWCEENEKFAFAIEHALEAKNFDKSMQLLNDKVEQLWENGHHDAIMKFGDILPDEIIKKNSIFCLFYSWILISSGQLQKAEKLLAAAEKIVVENLENKDRIESKKTDEIILGKISVVFAYLVSGTGKVEKIFHYCEQAERCLSEDNPLWYSWAWFSYGVAYLTRGELQESTIAYKKALVYGKKSGNLYLISTTVIRIAYGLLRQGLFKSAYRYIKDLLKIIEEGGYAEMAKAEWSYAGLFSILSYIQYMWNEQEEAMKNAKLGFDLCKKGNDISLKVFGSIVFAKAMLSDGDNKNAKETIDELFKLMESKEIPPYLLFTSSAWRIDILIEQNQFDQANDIINKLDLKLDDKKTYANELVYIAYARLLISEYKLIDAEKLLTQLHPIAEEGKRIERLIEIKNLLAILHKLKGETEKAIVYLSESIVLAAEENLLMFFLLEGNNIGDILNIINKKQATSKTNIPKAFFEKIMLAFDTRKKRRKDSTTQALSDRELEVIKLVAANFSNQEIADKLFVSINTVKTHAKNIHFKLEVDNRVKAVARAKELGLL